MQLQSKIIVGAIVAIFACSAIVHARRGWNNAARTPSSEYVRGSRRSNYNLRKSAKKNEEEYVILDEEEAETDFGFSSLEGEFEWNKFHSPGYAEHIQDEEQDGTFYIAPKRDVERRLQQQQQQTRKVQTSYDDGIFTLGSDVGDDYQGIYAAGDVRDYSIDNMSTLLRSHEYVAFTKSWRGADHLVVTQHCSIKHKSEPGAYYCVDNKTVCVTAQSIPRFYGDHVTGGKCGTFPLDEGIVASLPEELQEAYAATCDGNACVGRK
ncbi:hypothetical protein IV203_012385 [Nitzschia inconspicua]|uniref:Uncharacterized protein n=1 Tax=Nitzschia inconspicua TaxID=303405 RepID=A0A9K3KVE7_9STRA|nr:hypothetical protein IV203_012385 [Nitzschia inconspicua]